jgi:hypothetical protein
MPKVTLLIENAKAIKPECLNCTFLNPKATATYKCHVKGRCPAIKVPSQPEEQLDEKLRELLDSFDAAAQSYGWERDQGSAEDSAAALSNYTEAKHALVKYLLRKRK